jgi:nucleoporin POM152
LRLTRLFCSPLKRPGRPPFQVRYRYANQLRGRYGAADCETFNSIQKTSRLQLRTSEPGHHEYHLIDFGDAAYPLQHLKDRPQKSAPRYSGTVLQHEVLSRPSAHFKASGPSSYCLNEKLVPRSGRHDDPTVLLTGKPPFKLNLNIKNVATSESRTAVVEVSTHEWKVDVPTYVLQTVGPHLVSIESFEDSSPCSPSDVDHDRRTFRIDVAETAAIVPFDRREDWCVGDILQFQLEGNAPWRVE